MTTQHISGKLHVGDQWVRITGTSLDSEDGSIVAVARATGSQPALLAARLVLCWNSHDALTARVAELRELLQRLVNLNGHPYFVEQSSLPAWDLAIAEARAALAKPEGDK